jgi:recombination protein RecR
MELNNPLSHLVQQLSKFPGVGEKSAQRLAFFLLSLPKEEVGKMAQAMIDTRNNIRYCDSCFNISFQPRCYLCSDERRDRSMMCIVASPKDIVAFERSGEYKGVYHVLGGLLSPIDGIHPEMLRIEELVTRLRTGEVTEIILAINATVEGDTTCLYLSNMLSGLNISISKLAYGLPVGADIDYADELTLQKALTGRKQINPA